MSQDTQNRLNRIWSLPVSLIDQLSTLPINRSAAISISISNAYENPQLLIKALQRRLDTPPSNPASDAEPEVKKVTVTMAPKILGQARHLEQRIQLSLEHIVRLAVEAFLNKL